MSPGLLLPYVVEVGGRADTRTGRAGLPPVVETLRALGLERVIEAEVRVRQRAGTVWTTSRCCRPMRGSVDC